jgi:hypothetical protein
MDSWVAPAELPGAVVFVEIVSSSAVLVIATFHGERITRNRKITKCKLREDQNPGHGTNLS